MLIDLKLNKASVHRHIDRRDETHATNNEEWVVNVQNKQLTNISNIISQFLNYDVYFKLGNPSSFDKQLFYTFSINHRIETPITWDYYNYTTPNWLPTGSTLNNSISSHPLEWAALETYVGFSEIPELVYSDNGSYITDFFIDLNVQFTEKNVKDFANGLPSTSYAVIDSGYKYMYDRYNDVFRFVPLNGDIAGLCARTDNVADAWFSPGGFNRGQVRGAVKLAFNPNQTQRDELYKARVNPVTSFPGQGTVLFGDKTAQSKPSAFDRINVRRLFIVLEKAVSTAAKFQLFEFNDEFTRAQFRNLVEPFLRDVQGRRGLTDFSVVCDDTNNTGDVIDRNEFRADIFVKPARSINFIQLNFIATRSGVSFSEVAGS
mgnify:CR=1 FL=1